MSQTIVKYVGTGENGRVFYIERDNFNNMIFSKWRYYIVDDTGRGQKVERMHWLAEKSIEMANDMIFARRQREMIQQRRKGAEIMRGLPKDLKRLVWQFHNPRVRRRVQR